MSDVFELPVKFRYDIEDYCRYTYIKNMNMHKAGIEHNASHARAVNVAVNNHDKLVDLLLEHKEFNEAMHEMEAIWTIKESIRLHKATCELLKELGHEI